MLTGDAVRWGAAVDRAYDCDAYTVDRSAPAAVVLPSTEQEVQAVVRWCVASRVPFTPRGAGTGLSGGAMPALGGVVISTKRLNRILEVDLPNQRLHAEAGVTNSALSKAVAHAGLHFAPDPSSQTVSTLGGNIAENSGGPHTLKYGVTAPHILTVRVVSPNGEMQEFGRRVVGGPGPAWERLVVGSEGLLGVVVSAWVHLTPVPKAVQTVLVALPTIRAASDAVASVIASGIVPAALEMMDRNILMALKVAFGLEFPADTAALLLLECDGEPKQVEEDFARMLAILKGFAPLELRVASDEAERKSLWTARKKGIGAMGRLAPTIVTHDGVIPPSTLPDMLEFVYAVAAREGIGVANLFHAGDGNLHPCFYFDDRDPKQVESVVRAGEEIMRKCLELGGSLTGEHGIGVEKVGLMHAMFGPEDMALQRRVKELFNPDTLCNPCKLIPDQKGCVEHMVRWRGVAT